jgi:hypothetical protein
VRCRRSVADPPDDPVFVKVGAKLRSDWLNSSSTRNRCNQFNCSFRVRISRLCVVT